MFLLHHTTQADTMNTVQCTTPCLLYVCLLHGLLAASPCPSCHLWLPSDKGSLSAVSVQENKADVDTRTLISMST